MRFLSFVLLSFACGVASAQPAATYRVTFEATWSAASHPAAFPSDAHFSPPVGATHEASVSLWSPGGLASPGMEQMAETGATALLNTEIAAAGARVGEPMSAAFLNSPGQVETTFTVTGAHPLVTFVTMIAPSPDWFLGVHDLDLRDAGGNWPASVTVPLLAYDAGTDSGVAYTSPNFDTQPRAPIARLTTPPFESDVPLGTFTFTRLSVAGEATPQASELTLTIANPATAGAPLRVDAPAGASVTVDVFSVAGRRVATMDAGAGETLALPALPAGVYVLRAASGRAQAVRVLTVIR